MGRKQSARKSGNTVPSVKTSRSPYFTRKEDVQVVGSVNPKKTRSSLKHKSQANFKTELKQVPPDTTTKVATKSELASIIGISSEEEPSASSECSLYEPEKEELGILQKDRKTKQRKNDIDSVKRVVSKISKAKKKTPSRKNYLSSDSEYWGSSEGSGDFSSSEEFLPDSSVKRSTVKKIRSHKLNAQKPAPTKVKHEKLEKIVKDSEDECDWEDVDEASVEESDLLNTLLAAKQSYPENNVESSKVDVISVEVDLNAKRSGSKDPQLLAKQAYLRRLKANSASIHLLHVMCFLAHSRTLNLLCDSPLYRAIGLSLLNRGKIHHDKIKSWTLKDLNECASSFLANIRMNSSPTEHLPTTLLHRVNEGCPSHSDCVILFVGALRNLGLDVRLMVGLKPLPLLPTVSRHSPKNASMSKETSDVPKKKRNRAIVSSSSEDSILYSEALHKSSTHKIVNFMEIYLPTLKRWVFLDFSTDDVVVDKPPSFPGLYYVLGITTSRAHTDDCIPYVGRNPSDLAAKYDPGWCVESRCHRLAADKWTRLLCHQKHLFDLDAALNQSLRTEKRDSISLQRDRQDDDEIRSCLLSKPLPAKQSDFKNHPLYALQRHLLKFEVIYPPDAVPLGFYRGEPVYSRDCVHLCHTRESWLKEAKVVKLHEQPAKVVKARMSLRRKLLQGSDPNPQTVDVFGPWQVEDYKPAVAENGVVPRNAHGTIDLFKPCMLPIGCTHICLSGIHLIARKLNIDCAPAITGWAFHRAGWAIPQVNGYVVCNEHVPILIDAWRANRMNAAKAAAEERSNRAIENWRRLVRGLFLWHKVRAKFALSVLHDDAKTKKSKGKQRLSKSSESGRKELTATEATVPVELGTVTAGLVEEGWQRLSHNTDCLPTFPTFKPEAPSKPTKRPWRASVTTTTRRRKRVRKEETSTEESSDQSSSTDFEVPRRNLRSKSHNVAST